MEKGKNLFKSFFSWRSDVKPERQQPAVETTVQPAKEKRSYTYANADKFMFLGATSTSGATVTPETALSHATVYACVKVIAESIASLPVALYRSLPGGGSEQATNRPEHRLMAISPSDRYTSYKFRETSQYHLGLRGNSYARIFRDGRGTARELVLIHPDCCRPFFHNNKLFYEVTPNEYGGYSFKQEILGSEDILHVYGMSTDGVRGRSPITVLRETIGNGLTGRDFAGKTLKGGVLQGLLKHKDKQSPEQIEKVRTFFQAAMMEGRIPLLENGMEFQTVSMTPADAQYITQANLNRQEVGGAYRVPLHMIGDYEHATFSNVEHLSLEFMKYCLLPWVKNWEEELNRKLIPYSLQGEYFYRYNLEGLLRADLITRMRSYALAIQWGIMNRDEVRDLENRNPIPDGLGQEFITPLNMANIGEDLMKDQATEGEGKTDNTQKQQQNGTRAR